MLLVYVCINGIDDYISLNGIPFLCIAYIYLLYKLYLIYN